MSTPAVEAHHGSLLDAALGAFDVVITESVVVDADLDVTYDAARSFDFMRVRTPLAIAAMWVRGLPERFGRDGAHKAPRRLVIAEGDELPGWQVLDERPGTEIAFGAVGRFWKSRIEWRDVPREQFSTFAEPGYGKIACALRVAPCGEGRTLLTYECRTATTSADARRAFARYWWLVRPFVAHIMRATLATIRRDAEGSAR